tara:strand:+ start:98 stop:304 length:207 start_codon:yes stop_codon:yes gene_type:complete
MRLTPEMLRTMIVQEMRNIQNKKVMQEGTYERPIQLTAETLNNIIREEYEAHTRRQRLAEARRRRARR